MGQRFGAKQNLNMQSAVVLLTCSPSFRTGTASAAAGKERDRERDKGIGMLLMQPLPNKLSQTDSFPLHFLLTFTQRPKIRLIIHPKPPALCGEGDLLHHAFISHRSYKMIKTLIALHDAIMQIIRNCISRIGFQEMLN